MAELPEDPHGEGYVVEDECAAVGMAVLDVFCDGADFVIVKKTNGTFSIFGFGEEDEPTSTVGTVEMSAGDIEDEDELLDGYEDEFEDEMDDE